MIQMWETGPEGCIRAHRERTAAHMLTLTGSVLQKQAELSIMFCLQL